MWPTLFEISTPWFNMPVRGYGVMLMIGFLGSVWWTCRRAARVKANPDVIINMAIVGLFAGVVGARLFYVIHYYDRDFANGGWWPIFNVTQGGMEFYGSFIGCFVGATTYLLIRKHSFRLYMDIVAPAFMFGIAMGRVGCFLNGCCWGGLCPPEMPWGVRFPHASRAYMHQWQDRLVTMPAELIRINRSGMTAYPLNYEALQLSGEEREFAKQKVAAARKALTRAKRDKADASRVSRLEATYERARKQYGAKAGLASLLDKQAARFGLDSEELRLMALSPGYRTLAVHPVQLYAAVNGLVGCFLLSTLFYRRKRHGVVSGLFFFIYPTFRIIEEAIRSDNPYDTLGLTVSTFTSLVLYGVGIVWMLVVLRSPLRSSKLQVAVKRS